MNDAKTLLGRRAVKLGQVSAFALPPWPRLPEAVVRRLPELSAWQQEMERWHQQTNAALVQLFTRGTE
jgi:hypothetical protein